MVRLGGGDRGGACVGLGGFTFVYARGYSYLTDNPAACANCHVMSEQFAGWSRGSHRSVAVRNDCHTPASTFGRYTTKASNGFWHSYYFTFGGFPDPIQMTPRNRAITQAACLKCHAENHEFDCRAGGSADTASGRRGRRSCRPGDFLRALPFVRGAPAMTGRRLLVVGVMAAVAAVAVAGVLVTIIERKTGGAEPVLPRGRSRRGHGRPGGVGPQLPVRSTTATAARSIRCGPPLAGSEPCPARRPPSSAFGGGPVAPRRGPAAQDDLGGYAFSKDFREERGHAFMLEDQVTPSASGREQPGTCIHCHASVATPYRKVGGGDVFKGFEALNRMPYAEARGHVKFPVACIDYHDP